MSYLFLISTFLHFLGLEEWDAIHKSDSLNKAITKTIPGGTVFNNFFKSISKVLGNFLSSKLNDL